MAAQRQTYSLLVNADFIPDFIFPTGFEHRRMIKFQFYDQNKNMLT